jgi:hypothetical protein
VNVWNHGTKPCVRVTYSWANGKKKASVVVTADHPMVLRDGTLRHAGVLREGDKLMPFRRRTVPAKNRPGVSYAHITPHNDRCFVGEHRVVRGFYVAGDGHQHVHHIDQDTLNNSTDNLEVMDHLDHFILHKDEVAAGRKLSLRWFTSVSDKGTRSRASKKAWIGRRLRAATDKTFGKRASVLDLHLDKIGVLKDAEVAKLAGCTSALVSLYRKQHGIAPPVAQQGGLRGLLSENVLWRRLLHDHTDVEIARLVNTEYGTNFTAHAVRNTRKLLGVPAVSKARHEVYPRRGSKLDAHADKVGHVSDVELAREVGCTSAAVAHYRKTRGIPAYWREAPGGTNHTVVSVEPAGVHEVWDIEVDHEDHNFALADGIFVHNSQYMATVETVHKLIQKTELPAVDPVTRKPIGNGITDLPYAKLPQRRVRMMRDNWLKGAPEFESGWAREIEYFRRQGFLLEDVGGRRRDFLDGEAPNEIVNFPIQATAAALMNKALILLFELIPLNKWGPGTGIINQCHDSIVVECPEAEAPRVARLLEECMNQEHPALPGVRITASATIGRTWKEVG